MRFIPVKSVTHTCKKCYAKPIIPVKSVTHTCKKCYARLFKNSFITDTYGLKRKCQKLYKYMKIY